MNDDGSMTVYTGKRLNIYTTTVQGATDYSVEFKKMYVIEDGTLYVINGGYVNIPQGYKSRDNDDNLVISAQFFEDYPNFFEESDGKMYDFRIHAEPKSHTASGRHDYNRQRYGTDQSYDRRTQHVRKKAVQPRDIA